MKRLNEPTQNAYTHNGKHFALVNDFHQLHCVDLVRKYVYRDSYPEYMAFHDTEKTVSYHAGTSQNCKSEDEMIKPADEDRKARNSRESCGKEKAGEGD